MSARWIPLLLLFAACANEDGPKRGAPALDAELELEIAESVSVHIESGADARANVVLSKGFGIAPADEELRGPARIDAYPEANAVVYTARLAAPAMPGGPCGDRPISLALSLHRADDGAFVAGGLTPYCGADTWHGVPAVEPLRISGRVR